MAIEQVVLVEAEKVVAERSWFQGLSSIVSTLYTTASTIWKSGYEAAHVPDYQGLSASEALKLYNAAHRMPRANNAAKASIWNLFQPPTQDTSMDPPQITELWSVICRSLMSWPVAQDKYAATLSLVSRNQRVDYSQLAQFVAKRWGNLADLADHTHAVAGEDFHPLRTVASRASDRFQKNYGSATIVLGVGLVAFQAWRWRWAMGKVFTFTMPAARFAGRRLFSCSSQPTTVEEAAAHIASIPGYYWPAQFAGALTGFVGFFAVYSAVLWGNAFIEEVAKICICRVSNKHVAAGILGAMDVGARITEGATYNGPLALICHLYLQYRLHLHFMDCSDSVISRTNRHALYNGLVAPILGFGVQSTGEVIPPGHQRANEITPRNLRQMGDACKAAGAYVTKSVSASIDCLQHVHWLLNRVADAIRALPPVPTYTSLLSASAACLAIGTFLHLYPVTPKAEPPTNPDGQSRAVKMPKEKADLNDFDHRTAALEVSGMVQQGKKVWVTPDTYMDHPGTGVWVTSVCTTMCDVSPIAPGNKILTSGDAPVCTADRSRGYQCLLPLVNRLAVYSFASCYCNLVNCFSNRMAGVPARYKAAYDADPTGATYYNERNLVRRNWQVAIPALDVYSKVYTGLVARKEVCKLDLNEWLKRYPSKMGQTILANWLTRDVPRTVMKAMVKFEKNVARDPDFGKPKFAGIMALDDKKHVRGISIPALEARAEVGPSCHYASKAWAVNRSGRMLYAVGTVEWQRADWWDAAQVADDLMFAAYAGDNILFAIGPASDRRALCVDIKRMDMHVDPLAGGRSAIGWLTLLGEQIAADFFEKTVNPKYKVHVASATLEAEIEGTQPSGAGHTTLNNSQGVDVPIHALEQHDLNISDDDLEVVVRGCFSHFGFVITYDCVHLNERPLDVEFLQQRFYLALDGATTRRVPGNRIGRILARTFWTDKPLNLNKKKGFLRGVALGLEKSNRHVPIINDLLHRILELTSSVAAYYDEDTMKKLRWKAETDFEPIAFNEHPGSEQEIADHIGRPVTEIQELRAHIRTMPLFGFLNTPSTQDLVEAFLDWDL
jgi:hypothetical protein